MERYITRLLGASRYVLGASGYERPSRFFPVRVVEENLGRAMCTLGSVSVPTSSTQCLWPLNELKPGGCQEKPYKGSIYFSVDDLQNLPVDDEDMKHFRKVLPVMYRTFYYKRWSLLQGYCCSKDSIVDIKVALEEQLVAICVWLLLTDVPTRVKEGVAWALRDICSKTCEATNTDINYEGSAVHAPTKMSIDQESVDALLVDVLCSKNEEVLRQVCCSLGFLACCTSYPKVSFGIGIQKKLIQVSLDWVDSPAVLSDILFAISRIAMIDQLGMREKIIEAELSDGLLRTILSRKRDKSLEVEAYYMIYAIVNGQCNDKIWKYLKEHLMPAVVKRCWTWNIHVMRTGAGVISKFTAKASPDCIKEMVDLGCLKTLFGLLSESDLTIKDYCLDAFENILSAGDADPSKNEYAKMIDDLTKDWEHTFDWEVFFIEYPDSNPELSEISSRIVKKYRPDKYEEWLEGQDYLSGWC